MKTAISETVSDTTVKPISRAPSKAAASGVLPFSMLRTMFSIMTMASSTTKPVPIVRAIKERLSSENPLDQRLADHIVAKVAMIESGRLMPAMIVARTLRRKNSTTSTTRTMATTSVNSTSAIEARMVPVRSFTMSRVIPLGRTLCRRGNSFFSASTVPMMLAPGWRKTSRITAGSPLYQPPTRLFSSPSTTLATSLSMTGLPATQLTTTLLY